MSKWYRINDKKELLVVFVLLASRNPDCFNRPSIAFILNFFTSKTVTQKFYKTKTSFVTIIRYKIEQFDGLSIFPLNLHTWESSHDTLIWLDTGWERERWHREVMSSGHPGRCVLTSPDCKPHLNISSQENFSEIWIKFM